MKRPRSLALLTIALLVSSCGTGARNLQSALSVCSSNSSAYAEVYIPDATVVRVLGERAGRSGEHEGFVIRANGQTFRVEDNVGITGPIPLQRGNVVSLLGQLECDDDVIHWTHHDPSGRHQSGYIKVNGTLYE
ncbi:MAG TPA: DUF3465 domain-containing protein [Candidatus Baltobacteraceae bacterium]|nr:DUF3465 domain-containing protein [Candidatus Baltobacteraceae bacterium]